MSEGGHVLPSDEQIGTIHFSIKRFLQEAKDNFTANDFSVTDLEAPDLSATKYDALEAKLRAMVTKEPHEQRMYPKNDERLVWATLDDSLLGIVSLGTVDKYIKEELTSLVDMKMLVRAHKTLLASKSARFDIYRTLTVDRRSWVSQTDFMLLLCHHFIVKRFWEIWESIGDPKEITAAAADAMLAKIDVREFNYILKRAGVKVMEQESGAWFELCLESHTESEHEHVPLLEVCHITVMKVFFPTTFVALDPAVNTRNSKYSDDKGGKRLRPPKSSRPPKSGRGGKPSQEFEGKPQGRRNR